MLASLLFAFQAQVRDGNLPIQIVPASQNQFERKVNILESKGGTPSIFLFNDPGISDKAYEAIVKNPQAVQVVMMLQRNADESIRAWYPDGSPADSTPLNLPKFTDKQFPVGSVAAVIDYRLMMQIPQGPQDPPNVGASLVGSAGAATVAGRNLRIVQSIGEPKFKFGDLRVNFRVMQYVGTFSKEPNASKTIEDVTFKVVGPMTDQADRREHIEVIQSDVPNVGSFQLGPVIDWVALERDRGPVRNRNAQTRSVVIQNADGTRPEKDFHINISSNIPYRYWSGINVYRASNISGYFANIALVPR